MKWFLDRTFERNICCSGGSKGGGAVEPTPDQNTQQQVNALMWNHYQKNYEPYIEKYSATTQANQDLKTAQVTGQTNAEVMKNLPRPNSNPVANTQQMSNATQIASGAQQLAVNKAKQHELGSMENLVAIGRGQATQAQAGLNDLASQSLKQEIGMNDVKMQEATSMANAVGTGVGATAALATRPTNQTLAQV
jgi:hypothetical protein